MVSVLTVLRRRLLLLLLQRRRLVVMVMRIVLGRCREGSALQRFYQVAHLFQPCPALQFLEPYMRLWADASIGPAARKECGPVQAMFRKSARRQLHEQGQATHRRSRMSGAGHALQAGLRAEGAAIFW